VVTAGKLDQFGDFADFVAGVVACAEARAADVHGVSAMQDGLAGNGDIAGRAEQFQVMLGQGHSFFSQAVTGKGRIVPVKHQGGTSVPISGTKDLAQYEAMHNCKVCQLSARVQSVNIRWER